MKRYSISLVIKKVKIKTTIKCHFTPFKMVSRMDGDLCIYIYIYIYKTSADRDMERLVPLYPAGKNVKWYSHMDSSLVVPQKN